MILSTEGVIKLLCAFFTKNNCKDLLFRTCSAMSVLDYEIEIVIYTLQVSNYSGVEVSKYFVPKNST